VTTNGSQTVEDSQDVEDKERGQDVTLTCSNNTSERDYNNQVWRWFHWV